MVIEKWSIGIRPIPLSVENSHLLLVPTRLVAAWLLFFSSFISLAQDPDLAQMRL